MNTSDLIDSVAGITGSTKAEAKKNVEAVVSALTTSLAAGNEVNLNGFGKFTVKDRAAREGRNPATGESITIAASKSVGFKPAKALKDTL